MEGFASGPVMKVDFCPELAKKACWRVRAGCQTAAVVMSGDGVITGVYMLDRQECYAELAPRLREIADRSTRLGVDVSGHPLLLWPAPVS
jgi:hypothetical protein